MAETTERCTDCEPVGAVEIAEILGVNRSTVDIWRQRPSTRFPDPRWKVGGRPAWDKHDITAWAEATGRTVAVP